MTTKTTKTNPAPDAPWTEDDVLAVVTNPVYVLTDPPIISEDQWVKANVNAIREMGPEAYLRRLLRTLRASTEAGGRRLRGAGL